MTKVACYVEQKTQQKSVETKESLPIKIIVDSFLKITILKSKNDSLNGF